VLNGLGLDLDESLDYHTIGNKISIKIPGNERNIGLGIHQIHQINAGKIPNKLKGFTFYPNCGFSFDNYSEFLIKFSHPKLGYLSYRSWFYHPSLVFHIGTIKVEINSVSPIFKLLLGLHFYNDEYELDDFFDFDTIKILNNDGHPPKEICHKALYLLNSSHLINTDIIVSVSHLGTEADYHEYSKLENKFEKLCNERRPPYQNLFDINPLKIYNYACTLEAENKFLALYRVLEYYFNRYKLKKIDQLRYDQNTATVEIIKTASLKTECDYLIGLAEEVLIEKEKINITSYASKNNLIIKSDFVSLIKKLYEFRNSIVHAKETKLDLTLIKDAFDFAFESQTNGWIYIIQTLATAAIQYYNVIDKNKDIK
jgi:hypothetical protein